MTRRTAAEAPVADRAARPDAVEETFVPKGAIAFFAAMIVFYVALWFGLYALLVQRG